MAAGKRVLIVDDEADILELMSLALRSGGFVVDAARTAADAHARLDRARYDAVVAD
jgi:DNA-binding response OmpR family regulator